ncbi:MAG: hypothetical protein IT376_08680 [Polyangiaceae bacterium]|nr:hypothetical protein [Polyangiaceae bacterium]
MTTKRKLLIGGLALGALAGFGAGFARLGACAHERHAHRRAAFEDRVADVCVRAAERARGDGAGERAHLHGPRGHGPGTDAP